MVVAAKGIELDEKIFLHHTLQFMCQQDSFVSLRHSYISKIIVNIAASDY